MDPATLTGLAAVFALIQQYGPWGLAGVAVFLVLRAWRSGEFLPKSFHDTVVKIKDERYAEALDRYKASQDGLAAWRQNSEAALKTAEQAQERQREVMAGVAAFRQEVEAAHASLRAAVQELQQDVRELRGRTLGRDRDWEDPGRGQRRPFPREGA